MGFVQPFSRPTPLASRRTAAQRVVRTAAARSNSSTGKKRVLITGGNTGIGYESARQLLEKGYAVTIACRDEQKMRKAAEDLRSAVQGAELDTAKLDLADLASVRDCASRLLDSAVDYDVVLNNAAVMACPKMSTKDGFEYQLGINHFGHFVFTNQLLPKLKASGKPVRIINVSSAAHINGKIDFNDMNLDKKYEPWPAYGRSKLANVLYTYELARRLEPGSPITVNALHPGLVRTELGRYMIDERNAWYMTPMFALFLNFFKSPTDGAATHVHLASSPAVEGITSKYWSDCRPVASCNDSYKPELAKKLWEVSEELTEVKRSTLATNI